MASVTKQEIPEMAGFMKDFWIYMKDYWKPDDTDEYFAQLMSAGDELWYKYGRDGLIRQLLLAYMKSREEALHEKPKRQEQGKMLRDVRVS